MKTFLLLITIALVGCAEPDRTHVHIIVPEGAARDSQLIDGANVWLQLGYVASWDDSGEPECETVGDADCQITVGVKREIGLADNYGIDGATDRKLRVITIDAQWSEWNLLAIMAHESGHMLLDTWRHTPPGERAVMAARGAEWYPQPADYTLACETIGVCL